MLTSDRPPRDLERARGPAAGALRGRPRHATSRPPDRATRLTILRKRVQQDGSPASTPAALELIADRVDHNVRALEGALIRVVAFASLTGRPVTAELAAEVLAGLYPDLKPRTAAPSAAIQEQTARGVRGLRSRSCSPPAAPPASPGPRQVAMYLARELTDATLPAIGRAFGGATTRPSSTPAGAPPSASPPIRDAYEAVRAPHRDAPAARVTPPRLTDSVGSCAHAAHTLRPHRARPSRRHAHLHTP